MKRKAWNSNQLRSILLTLLLVLLIGASGCGGSGSGGGVDTGAVDEAPAAGSGRVVPTMPAAQFAAPTTMIDATKVAGSRTTPTPVEADIVNGEAVYVRLCQECHGDNLEGVAGKAEPITEYTLDHSGLTDLLRTGGGYGPEHLFGLDKVSPASILDLQTYLVSLAE